MFKVFLNNKNHVLIFNFYKRPVQNLITKIDLWPVTS